MQKNKKYNLYWGDIHNHNALGYAKGSLERSIEIAKNHLDFFAFTGQSQWHDIKEYENDAHMYWLNGFKVHRDNWEKIQRMIAESDQPGKFVSFLGYEWHSSEYGDYCLIYPDDYGKLEFSNGIAELKSYAKKEGAVIIPHHIGYKKGRRGMNWEHFDESISPIIEMFSEHGCCERDGGAYPMIRHGMGGLSSENTYQNALKKGYHVGAVASSDNHLGYPGAYGEGLMAVLANELDRKSIWEAIWERRVYAVTGDRIQLDFNINGYNMGQILSKCDKRVINVDVNAWDTLKVIEVIKNNKVIHRHYAQKKEDIELQSNIKVRIEYGWGPWSDLNMPRICDWELELQVENGEVIDLCPCFQSGPFSETKRNKITEVQKNYCSWQSYTSRKQAFEEKATNAVVFEINRNENTNISLNMKKPIEKTITVSAKELMNNNISEFVGEFPAEQVIIHRAIEESLYNTSFVLIDKEESKQPEDFYYIRVTQDNGQMAWSSPIWVGN